MQRFFKDPLIIFLVAGAAVFAGYRLADDTRDPRHIRVHLDALTTFVQHRSQLQDPDLARARLAGMTAEELGFIIDSYVREEALYREALRLGFGDGDYVIRRRLAQKVEFMAEGAASALPPLDEAALRAYFDSHREVYRQPPTLTFTHVFFEDSMRGEAAARQLAEQTLAEFQAEGVGFHQAAGRGDAFLYHRSYVESSRVDLAGHFGETMADALFDLQPGAWRGPLQSPYGLHLVLVAARTAGGPLEFDEARHRVRTDAEQARRRSLTSARTGEIVAAYRVTVDSPLNGSTAGGRAAKKQADPNSESAAKNANAD